MLRVRLSNHPSRHVGRGFIAVVAILGMVGSARAADRVDFNRDVRPILSKPLLELSRVR